MGIISYVNEEIQVIRERDPAIKSNMEVFLYSSFKAILHYRIAHKGSKKDRNRDPSGGNNRKRIIYRPRKRSDHRRDCGTGR